MNTKRNFPSNTYSLIISKHRIFFHLWNLAFKWNIKSKSGEKEVIIFQEKKKKVVSIELITVRQDLYMISLLCLVLLADIVPFVIDLWEGKQ